eukprot:252057-Rhodomonas_salina.5
MKTLRVPAIGDSGAEGACEPLALLSAPDRETPSFSPTVCPEKGPVACDSASGTNSRLLAILEMMAEAIDADRWPSCSRIAVETLRRVCTTRRKASCSAFKLPRRSNVGASSCLR